MIAIGCKRVLQLYPHTHVIAIGCKPQHHRGCEAFSPRPIISSSLIVHSHLPSPFSVCPRLLISSYLDGIHLFQVSGNRIPHRRMVHKHCHSDRPLSSILIFLLPFPSVLVLLYPRPLSSILISFSLFLLHSPQPYMNNCQHRIHKANMEIRNSFSK